MATYIVLGNFTDQGIRNAKDTTERAKAFKEMASKLGVNVTDLVWTAGRYDLVIKMEAPNDEAVAAVGIAAGSLGNVRTETMRAFSPSEMGEILSKAGI